MSDPINDWKTEVCDTCDAYDAYYDISSGLEPSAATDYIAALVCLCAAYETTRTAPQVKPLVFETVDGWVSAPSPFGEYSICYSKDGFEVFTPEQDLDLDAGSYCKSVEAGIELAQSIHERRILIALDR